ncbi:hypothetical protein Tco_0292744, partial [Tanacetum coccineum]
LFVEDALGTTRITGQSWNKGRLPLSAENAGTSAAEDIDLDEYNEENAKKSMKTRRTRLKQLGGKCWILIA